MTKDNSLGSTVHCSVQKVSQACILSVLFCTLSVHKNSLGLKIDLHVVNILSLITAGVLKYCGMKKIK